jgi:hypothetical protein
MPVGAGTAVWWRPAVIGQWRRHKAVGVYVPTDPYVPEERAGDGTVAFDLGLYFQKELRVGQREGRESGSRTTRGRPAVEQICEATHDRRDRGDRGAVDSGRSARFAPGAGFVARGTDVDDVGTVPPIAAATRDAGSREAVRDVAAWDVVHRVVADVATARGVRALLRSTDGDFRITADRVDGKLALTIETRREQPPVEGDVDGEEAPERG